MDLTKPHITCLMECSVDGRLDRDRWTKLFDADHRTVSTIYYETLNALKPEGNLIGLNTVTGFFSPRTFVPAKPFEKPHRVECFHGIRDQVKMTAVFDFCGTLAYRNNKICDSNIIVILGSELVSEEYTRYLREHEVSYTFAGPRGTDLNLALNSLHDDFGLHKLVLEGGGTLNGSFLKAGLIDELVVVIYPGLDGLSGVKSIFEYQGTEDELPAFGQKLELVACETPGGGVVRLRYKIHHGDAADAADQDGTWIACPLP